MFTFSHTYTEDATCFNAYPHTVCCMNWKGWVDTGLHFLGLGLAQDQIDVAREGIQVQGDIRELMIQSATQTKKLIDFTETLLTMTGVLIVIGALQIILILIQIFLILTNAY